MFVCCKGKAFLHVVLSIRNTFTQAFGMEWLHAEFSLEREQYLDEMWEAYKKELRITSPKEKGKCRAIMIHLPHVVASFPS